VLIFVCPFIYIGNYAGDSQVHLIYGQNAADGNFFEFNLGEKSAGVTGPGYMLIIAGLFNISPDLYVPAVLKAINILAWYGLVFFVFLIAKRLFDSYEWALVAALAAGLMPGSVYNSTIGMENGIFGFLTVFWLYWAVRTRWFSASLGSDNAVRREILLGGLLGLACWIRPEGFVLTGVALGYRTFFVSNFWSRLPPTTVLSGIFLAPFLIFTGLLFLFHFNQTGEPIPTSGLSRILMSNVSSTTFHFGPTFIDTKFAIRLGQYFALTVPWLFANWLVLKRRREFNDHEDMIRFSILFVWINFLMFTAVLGATHLARYIIFVMPLMVLVSVAGARWLWNNWQVPFQIFSRPAGKVFLVGLAGALIWVFAAETQIRLGLDSQSSLWKSMKAPEERTALSDALLEQIGNPEELPVTIALQEIQIRYWLDDRFVVRSLDGRVDPVLLEFASRTGVDHIGYLKEWDVQVVLETPNYNRNSDDWSLEDLDSLQESKSLTYRGTTFSRLPIDRSVLGQAASNTRWSAGADGATVLQLFLDDLILVESTGPD